MVVASQQEGHHAQQAAAQAFIGLQRQGDIARLIGAEGDHAGAFAPSRRALVQLAQALVQRPAGSQRFGRIEVRCRHDEIQVTHLRD